MSLADPEKVLDAIRAPRQAARYNIPVSSLLDAELYADCVSVAAHKGADYAKASDPLANFRDASQQLNLEMLEVWAVYFYKHYAAIMAYCRNGQVESEPIRGRIIDAINYLVLLNRIIDEKSPTNDTL